MTETTKRRRRAPEQARELILQAAEAELLAWGPDGLTIKSVAERAGVSSGLVVHYFGSTAALAHAALRASLARFSADALRQLGEASNGPEDPGALASLVRRFLADFCQHDRARLGAWLVLSGEVGADAEVTAERRAQTRAFVEQLTATSGAPRELVETFYTLIYCAGFGLGLLGPWLGDALGVDAEELRRRLTKLVVASLPRKGRARAAR